LYEAMRRVEVWLRGIPRAMPRALSLVLVWVGGAALLVSCALLVYSAAVLLARLGVWFY
jgi:hypothetical protein